MPLEVGNKYRAAVTVAYATEKEDGTFGIAVSFHADEGDIEHTLWIEPGEFLKYRKADLKTLGATDDQMADWDWLRAPASLVGARCQIVMSEYVGKDGKSHLKVKYINSLRREAQRESAVAAARLLGGRSGQESAYPIGGPMPERTEEPPVPLWGQEILDESQPGF